MHIEFPEFNQAFFEMALARYEPWQLGNDVLYRLCKENFRHDSAEAIIAKFWLIGRAYAAAVERRKKSRDYELEFLVGDDFYTKLLVPCIQRSGIDLWFEDLRSDNTDDPVKAVRVHKKLTSALHNITEDNKRSLASKYLHFHFPEKFFIYDKRACDALNAVVRGKSESRYPEADIEYAKFFDRCKFLREKVQEALSRQISARILDCILVARTDLGHTARQGV